MLLKFILPLSAALNLERYKKFVLLSRCALTSLFRKLHINKHDTLQ